MENSYIVVFIVFIFAFAAFLCLVCFLSDKIIKFYYDKKDAKRRKEHPKLYQLFDELDEKSLKHTHHHNEEIGPRKRKIDALLKNLQYLPADELAHREKELEEIRQELYAEMRINAALEKEVQEMRDKIKVYVKNNDLKWAMDWGWK